MNHLLDWPEPDPDPGFDWPEPDSDPGDWPEPAPEQPEPLGILDQPAGTPGPLDCGCDVATVLVTGEHLKDCETNR